MRIALVLGSFPRNALEDPVFPAAWEMALEMKRQGHELLVLCFCDPFKSDDIAGTFDVEGIRVLRRPRDWSMYDALNALPGIPTSSSIIGYARELFVSFRDELAQFKPDVVECQEFNGLGAFFAASHEFPLVIRCYGPLGTIMQAGLVGDYPKSDAKVVGALEISTICAADGLITICHDMASTLSKLSGISVDDFSIIRTPFRITKKSFPEIRDIDSPGFPSLFFWGQVIKLKGVDTLIESLPLIKEKFPNFELNIGGREIKLAGDTSPLAERLKQRVAEFGLTDQVKFLGFLERSKIVELAQKSDICVFPSRYETACYTCLEAMSYGVPVVASRVGGLPEYCLDGECGLLFETGNSTDLAEKIITLAGDLTLRRKFAAAGIERVRTFCDPTITVELSVKKYEEAISNFSKRDARAALPYKFLLESIGSFLDNVTLQQMPQFLNSAAALAKESTQSATPPVAPVHQVQRAGKSSFIRRAVRRLISLAGIQKKI